MNYNEYRRKTKEIKVGSISIGGKSRVSVQSMLNTPAGDFDSALEQAKKLQNAGCDIVRISVPDIESANVIYKLKTSGVVMPIVADIHFDYRMAIESVAAGADKIRINPGNIGSDDRVKAVAKACCEKNIPIRIGVNSGSLSKELLTKYGAPTAEALAESAVTQADMLEKYDFDDIVVSIKSSDIRKTIEANKIFSQLKSYPLHLGVTEAGITEYGIIKNSIGIGSLLCDGIGDTVRLSLTDDPIKEIIEGIRLLDVLGINENTIDVVSCPTCGRTKVNIIELARELENRKSEIKVKGKLKIAVMGCAVNGPGEAREADIGIAGGNGEAILFKHGTIIRKLPEKGLIDELIKEINGVNNG